MTNLETFYGWVKGKIAPKHQHSIPNGILYLKGNEPINFPVQYHTYPLRHFFDDPFFETKQLIHLT